MPPSKNQIAATLTRDQAMRAGVLDAPGVVEHISKNFRKNYGFTDKILPNDLPTEPKIYIYSISEYGEQVSLGPGLPQFTIHPCPLGGMHGEPCEVDPIYFFKEAKVDQIEHTFHSGREIAQAIMKEGPGMNRAWDRALVGWFISATNPPSQEEVNRAHEIYLRECKRLIIEANGYHARNQLNEITDTHYRAARYTKEKVNWNMTNTHKMMDCCGCGESIRASATVHAVGYCGAVQGVVRNGAGKAIDPGRWADAIAMGMKKLDDAPEDIQDLLE